MNYGAAILAVEDDAGSRCNEGRQVRKPWFGVRGCRFEKDADRIRDVALIVGCGRARLLPSLFGKDLTVGRLGGSLALPCLPSDSQAPWSFLVFSSAD